MTLCYQQLRRKDEKLPLAVLLHYNCYFSFIFAVLTGRLVFDKHTNFFFCNRFQRDLLIPIYCIWIAAEVPRLYVGQMGVLRDKLPELAAFLLLTFFPQVFTVLYIGFLQEIIVPCDSAMGSIMLMIIMLEIVMAWKFLRNIINRQTNMFYRDVGMRASIKQ